MHLSCVQLLFVRMLMSIAVVSVLAACGGTDCEQDYPPPSERSTSVTPYQIVWHSNLDIFSVRWTNVTTGLSGDGTVGTGCVPLFGCGWTELEVNVDLDPGENLVYVFHSHDGCEWRDDYLITLN